jgi:hypothetical protein
MPKFTHAATEHAKMCRGRTASTMSGELLKKHHVGNHQDFDEHLVLFTINHTKSLLFNFNEIINKLFEQRHHVRFRTVASYRRSV